MYRKEGISLDASKVEKNSGLRDMAKRKLNALYGRIGLNIDKIKTLILDSAEEFNQYILDASIDCVLYDIINEDKIMLCFKYKNDFKEINRRGNVVIASFVSMYGRLELFKELKLLNKRVLYMDTDSLIFTSKSGDYEPFLCNMLGGWTDEITEKYGQDIYISEYCGIAPKAYGIKLNNNETIVKIKGTTLNLGNTEKLNFDILKNFVMYIYENGAVPADSIKIDHVLNFVRNKTKSTIINRPMVKKLSFLYDKRTKQMFDYVTYPYGFINQ